MVLQKEPCAKRMVAKAEKLLLGVDIDGEEGGLVADVGPTNIITQLYNGEGGEEVLIAKVECVDAELLMCQVDYNYEVEGDDQE